MTENNNIENNGASENSTNLISNSVLFNRKNTSKKVATCPLSGKNAPVIDYKNIELLSRYISEKGRILPSRLTGVCAKKQRELTKAIKQARNIALLPFAKQ
jgi:small subunit ribosomal protein S18